MTKLLEMLTYRRPGGSQTEREFIRRFIRPTGAMPDQAGNYHLRVGQSRVAWLSHTDTVHPTPGRQEVIVKKGMAKLRRPVPPPAPVVRKLPNGAVVRTFPPWRNDCLGADDTTGVWLMLEMIEAGTPGLYIFHRGEESGCVGSRYIARHRPHVLDGIDYAISLDRKGTDSVITHQLGVRTASDAFAWSFATAVGMLDEMAPDPSGVFTDSDSYTDLVPECTNISVGYYGQHSPSEVQDVAFAQDLRDRLCRFDESYLVVGRRLGEVDPEDNWSNLWDEPMVQVPRLHEGVDKDDPWWEAYNEPA